MKAQVCFVLLAICGFAFSSNFLDNSNTQAVEAVVATVAELGSEVTEAVNQAISEKHAGQSVHAILSNLSGFKGQVESTLMKLRNNLTQDSELMAQVKTFTNQITQQAMPTMLQFEALVAGARGIDAEMKNQTAMFEQIIASAEQFKTQFTFAIENNATELIESLMILAGQLETDLKPLVANILSGNETKAAIDNLVNVFKADISAFYANNTLYQNGTIQFETAIKEVFDNNSALFYQVQNFTNFISTHYTQLSTELTQQNYTDAALIATGYAQIYAAYSTALETIAANGTSLVEKFRQAGEQVYGNLHTSAQQIKAIIEKQIVMLSYDVKVDLLNTTFVQQLEQVAAQIDQQLQETFGQDAIFLTGLYNVLNHVAPNVELIQSAEQVKAQILASIHANKDNIVQSLTQLVSKVVTDLAPLAEQIAKRNETAIEAANSIVNEDVNAFNANNTEFKAAFEQIGASAYVAVANNSGLFSGFQNFSSQISAGLSDLAAKLTQENATDAVTLATSLKQAVDAFSTAFGNIAANNGSIVDEMNGAYKSAVAATVSPVKTEVKDQIETISDEVEGDIYGNHTNPTPNPNNNNNTNHTIPNNNTTNNTTNSTNQNTNGNTADNSSTANAAGKAMVSFAVVFGTLVAFFL